MGVCCIPKSVKIASVSNQNNKKSTQPSNAIVLKEIMKYKNDY